MIRRVLIVLAALAAFLVPAATAQAASTWQDSWNSYEAKASARPNGAVAVTYAEYLDVTQQSRAACGHFEGDAYIPPAAPASVRADIARDKAPNYFHKTTRGDFHWTGNGLPGVTYRSDHAGNYNLRVNGMTVIATRATTLHRAWVPDFRGAGCGVWTEIQTF